MLKKYCQKRKNGLFSTIIVLTLTTYIVFVLTPFIFDNKHRFQCFVNKSAKNDVNFSYWFEWTVYNLITDTLSSPYGIIIDMFEADISQGVTIQRNFYNFDKVRTFSEVFKLNFNDQWWKEIWNCLKLFAGHMTEIVKTHFLTKKIEFHKFLLLFFIVIF